MHDQPEKRATLGDAMMMCSKENARLVSPNTCDEMEDLLSEIVETFMLPDQSYFIGVFGHVLPEGSHYRNWRNHWEISSYVLYF